MFVDRKRMSVVVSDSSDQLWLFCKGADSFLLPLVVSGHREETLRHLNDFSMVIISIHPSTMNACEKLKNVFLN